MTNSNIKKAVELLRNGRLVAFPTETVYGLGADARNQAAVDKIFIAKERPKSHPLIVHIADASQLKDWTDDVSSQALMLAKKFWPGPLTLILHKKPGVLDEVTGGQNTIGIRIPQHPIALELLREFGGGIAAPSANKFTHISPTTSQAVRDELGDSVDLILEGGDCAVGLESTIIDLTASHPRILRPGMISAHQLMRVLNQVVAVDDQQNEKNMLQVPGMHDLHYAPTTKTYRMTLQQLEKFFLTSDEPTAFLTHSTTNFPGDVLHKITKLSSKPAEYAHDLYRVLRMLDEQNYRNIVIECVPETSDWDAIRDRIFKASKVC